jgi:hypothetical protein
MHDPLDPQECPYKVLEVRGDATATGIKKAFFPARRRGEVLAARAWELLRTPAMRLLHDAFHYQLSVTETEMESLPAMDIPLAHEIPLPSPEDLGDPLALADLGLRTQPPPWGEGRAIRFAYLDAMRARGMEGLPWPVDL